MEEYTSIRASASVTGVGSYLGDACAIVEEGQTWRLPNALIIGSLGYGANSSQAHNGTVILQKSSSLGMADNEVFGNHIDVGASVSGGHGELICGGGAHVSIMQLVVGNGQGTGYVEIGKDASLTVNHTGGVIIGGASDSQGNCQGIVRVKEGGALHAVDGAPVYVGLGDAGTGELIFEKEEHLIWVLFG